LITVDNTLRLIFVMSNVQINFDRRNLLQFQEHPPVIYPTFQYILDAMAPTDESHELSILQAASQL